MSLDFAEALDHIEQIIKTAPDVSSGMMALLDYCEAQTPDPLWSQIRTLNFKEDMQKHKLWLEKLLLNEPPKESINAFWFGLFESVGDDGESGGGLYVSGSSQFDPDDESAEWAAWDDDSYLPENRYANSQILDEIYAKLKKSDVHDIGEYVLVLGYAGLVVKSFCSMISREMLLGKSSSRALVVGFDSGDFLIVEKLAKA